MTICFMLDYRPGSASLIEIRKFQHTTDLLIPKLPFQRLVREVMMDIAAQEFKIQCAALSALQVADPIGPN